MIEINNFLYQSELFQGYLCYQRYLFIWLIHSGVEIFFSWFKFLAPSYMRYSKINVPPKLQKLCNNPSDYKNVKLADQWTEVRELELFFLLFWPTCTTFSPSLYTTYKTSQKSFTRSSYQKCIVHQQNPKHLHHPKQEWQEQGITTWPLMPWLTSWWDVVLGVVDSVYINDLHPSWFS